MIKETEDGIVAQLVSEGVKQKVVPFPADLPKYLERYPVQDGAIFVAYSGSTYTDPETQGEFEQTRTMHFNIGLLLRGLVDHSEGYPHLEAIMEALSGFIPEGASDPIILNNDSFMGEVGNAVIGSFWMFQLTYSITLY